MKLHWSPKDCVIASIVGGIAVGLVYLVHPGLHPVAYAAGWLFVAAFIYQTGSELSARRKSLSGERKRAGR